MDDTLLIDAVPGEIRAALIRGGRLAELSIEREASPRLAGNVYLGRVSRRVPGVAGLFVDIGAARAAFLPRDKAARGLTEGGAVMVQVARDAAGEKGPVVSRRIALAGRLIVLSPDHPGIAVSRRIEDAAEADRLRGLAANLSQGAGVTVRSAAAGAAGAAIAREVEAMWRVWRAIEDAARSARAPALLHAEPDPVGRAIRDMAGGVPAEIMCEDAATLASARRYCAAAAPELTTLLSLHHGQSNLFDRAEAEAEIAALRDVAVALPSGGRLSIETTRAVVAIDVDSGAASESGAKRSVALTTNLEAAAEVARQLRLRGLAGQVVVDFIDLAAPEDRRQVIATLEAAMADDPAQHRVIGYTRGGLVELTRARAGPSVAALLADADGRPSVAAAASDALRAAGRAARGAVGGRVRLAVAADVAAALGVGAPSLVDRLAAAIGKPVIVTAAGWTDRGRIEVVVD